MKEIKNPLIANIDRSNGNIEISISKKYDESEEAMYKSFMSVCAMDNKALVDTTDMDKKATIEALKQERALFNSFSVLDDYSHTNYFNNGDIWTNHWFIVNATGKFTGETNTVRVHTDLKWENGKVVIFQVYRDPSVTMKEATAMAEMSK